MLRALVLGLLLSSAALPALAAKVTVEGQALMLDGKPFIADGAAGLTRLDLLKRLGATTVRTYGEDPGPVLDAAAKVGLKVIAGFWLEHPRRGFDYRDPVQAGAQLQRLEAMVRRYRAHPALLLWGLGNEVEADLADDSQVWPAIEQAAKLVRQLDPDHPTMAVLAETGTDKVARLRRLAPSIQVLGVNSYGEALPSLPGRVRAQGWTGPLIVTELGPLGQWQARRTAWNAAIEPSSDEKALLLGRWMDALKGQVQGRIVFYWGQKQEVTPTWHSLLLASGEYGRSAEIMASAWGGATPGGNRAPRITRLAFSQGDEWPRAQSGEASIALEDPDGPVPAVAWQVMAESTDLKTAGDAESVPRSFPQAIRATGPGRVAISGLPAGAYRLMVVVRDAQGAAATANLPFRVR